MKRARVMIYDKPIWPDVSKARKLMDGFCGEKEKFAAVFCKEFVERVIIGDVEQMPVIETGAL